MSAPLDFADPRIHNGSWLTFVPNTYPAGLGEPLNVVVRAPFPSVSPSQHDERRKREAEAVRSPSIHAQISAQSDPDVLQDTLFKDWIISVGYIYECLDLHLGAYQAADLGDGNGIHNQTDILRWAYGYFGPSGACLESVLGGSHARYWNQDGPLADTGAVFLAVSNELNSTLGHDIVPDGYDLGRDWFVGNATNPFGTTSALTGIVYNATVNMTAGYLQPGSTGINHGLPIDGLLAVLTVQIQSTSAESLDGAGIGVLIGFFAVITFATLLFLRVLRPSKDYSFLVEDRFDEYKKRRRKQLRREIMKLGIVGSLD